MMMQLASVRVLAAHVGAAADSSIIAVLEGDFGIIHTVIQHNVEHERGSTNKKRIKFCGLNM